MLILFPLIYVLSFFAFLFQWKKTNNASHLLIFIVFGLSIYMTSLSITYLYTGKTFITLLQSLKEIAIIVVLFFQLKAINKKPYLTLVDQLMLAFLAYSAIYILLPLGNFSLVEKLLAYKSLSFFPFIYFTGRLLPIEEFYLNKYFKYIGVLSISASIVLVGELITYTHFQTITGFALFNKDYFDVEPSGNYGLTWTFEIENGTKRFASFFSNPLEQAAATLVTLAVFAGLYTRERQQLKLNSFASIVMLSTLLSIIFSLSRASFVSYFMMIYVYALITNKKFILQLIHFSVVCATVYIIYQINTDIAAFIINTLNFSNASSYGHVIEWIAGLEAMASNPLGLGLGTSGRIAGVSGDNIGGENQFIIIGVQIGIIGMLLYAIIYFKILQQAWIWRKWLTGKEQQLALAVILMKIGFIIPLLTANFESYIYVSYISWFFSGLMMQVVANKNQAYYVLSSDIVQTQ